MKKNNNYRSKYKTWKLKKNKKNYNQGQKYTAELDFDENIKEIELNSKIIKTITTQDMNKKNP